MPPPGRQGSPWGLLAWRADRSKARQPPAMPAAVTERRRHRRSPPAPRARLALLLPLITHHSLQPRRGSYTTASEQQATAGAAQRVREGPQGASTQQMAAVDQVRRRAEAQGGHATCGAPACAGVRCEL